MLVSNTRPVFAAPLAAPRSTPSAGKQAVLPTQHMGFDNVALSRVRARAADPLPEFSSPEQYRSYVINLVASSLNVEKDLDAARKRLDTPQGSQLEVANLSERLDAIKLQLKLLRDSYPLPAEWTRPRLFGGQGFDNKKFWHDQVEAIPGKEVVVTKPAPAPAKPAAPAPAPTPAVVVPAAPVAQGASGDLSPALVNLLKTYTHDAMGSQFTNEGLACLSSKLQAITAITGSRSDQLSRRVDLLAHLALNRANGATRSTYYSELAALRSISVALNGGDMDMVAHKAVVAAAQDAASGSSFTTEGLTVLRTGLQSIRDNIQGSSAADLKAVDAFVAWTLAKGGADTRASYFALGNALEATTALATSNGSSLGERARLKAISFVGSAVNSPYTTEGMTFMRSKMETVVVLYDATKEPRLAEAAAMAKGLLATGASDTRDSYNAFSNGLQAMQALLA